MKGRAFAAVLAVVGLLTGVLASVADPASAVAGSAGGSTLYAGQQLTDYSEALVSPNGEFNLLLDRGDPTLLELDRFYRSSAYTGGDSWEALGSLTPGLGVGSLRMQMDGNLVLYAASTGRALWSTRTAGSGAGNRLIVQDDGNLVLYSDGGRALWQSNTRALLLTGGQSLAAGRALLARPKPGSWIEFAMQTDGNLVLYVDGRAVWASRTVVRGSHVAVQTDGNLVVYAPGGAALWDANTYSRTSEVALLVQQCGVDLSNEVTYQSLWSEATDGC